MKKYLINFTHGVQTKNKLQEEIYLFAKSFHRVCIKDEEFNSTLIVIKERLNELVKHHKRCRTEEVDTYDGGDGDRYIGFGGDGFCRLQFLKFED